MSKKTSLMEFDFKTVDTEKLAKECDDLVKQFEELLDQVDPRHGKKKMLWRQIFENALTDRRNAYIMFNNLYLEVHGNSGEHAVHGQTLVKYLERMSKSNDQIIKLAEILDEAISLDEASQELIEEDMYEQLEKLNKKGK